MLRKDCDLVVDLCDMKNINNNTFDLLIAFDILEHVESLKNALTEINRVLTKNGYAIFTVPQKDGLKKTIEESSLINRMEKAPQNVSDILELDELTRVFAKKLKF